MVTPLLGTRFATLSLLMYISISRPQCHPIKNALYTWLCIGSALSPIQLVTALVTKLHNRFFRPICGVGLVLCEYFILSFVSANDTSDVAFLTAHGINLFVLDLNLNVDPRAPVDIPTILDICPALTPFTFNADLRINPTGAVSNTTKLPHPHISTIGLHGLSLWGYRLARIGLLY